MNIILIGFWICERALGRTKLEFQAWLVALDAEVVRAEAEAPAGWKSSQLFQDHRTSDLMKHPASSSLSFSR